VSFELEFNSDIIELKVLEVQVLIAILKSIILFLSFFLSFFIFFFFFFCNNGKRDHQIHPYLGITIGP
jgi:hypothetical protein